MSKTNRIAISLPKELLDEFDEVLRDRHYHSRSKGIRDAMKDYIVRYKWMNEMEGERVGTLSFIFNHYHSSVVEDLITIQHDFHTYINAVMHVHLTENLYLEVMVVKGDMKYIRDLTGKIMRLKDVEQVKLTSTSSGQEMEKDMENL